MTHIVHRFIHSRPRLALALLVGIAVSFLLPEDWQILSRALMGWNVAVWFYLCAMGWMMARASHARVRTISDQQDISAPVVLALLSIAAVFSVSAIIFVLAGVKELPMTIRMLRYGFTALTVGGSWLLVAIMFTFHYAHMFYRSPADQRRWPFLTRSAAGLLGFSVFFADDCGCRANFRCRCHESGDA